MVMAERAGGRGHSFHLSGRDRDSVSSASLYKQRIDSMFDEERSVISHTYGVTQQPSLGSRSVRNKPPSISGRLDGPGGLVQPLDGMRARSGSHGGNSLRREGGNPHPGGDSISRAGNSVQASIERMFSELAMETDTNITGTHTFSVDYLGSTPLPRRVTSLAGLQAPLSKLYLAYRRTKPIGTLQSSPELAARLEISRAGLHVRHCGPKGDLEQLNPYPTIAVWSAVKFVLQPSEEDKNAIEFAFLPLITDPDNIDKQALFRNLDPSERKYILGRDGNSHSPLFTVVMRKIGVAKQLECHGFVCQTSEDAIVIAATLYKSLMAHMSRVPRAKGGITGPSIASSSAAPVRPPRRKRTPSTASNESDRHSMRHDTLTRKSSLRNRRTPDKMIPPPPPPPPPNQNQLSGIEQVKAKLAQIKTSNEAGSDRERTSKTPPKTIYNESMDFLNKQHKNLEKQSKESTVRSKVSEKIEMFTGLEKSKDIQRPVTVPPPVPIKPKKNESLVKEAPQPKQGPLEPLRRSHSMRNSSEPGDILTKVAIPRSGSFLNASGLSRYKSTGHRNNGKKGGGSPLGFSELFNEFRVQEDLHSMDDILGAIIDAEGMSFNDLKPIYKEFLLKLAVTLTKDELFQHSKAIMRRQKKKLLRRNSTVQNKRKKMLIGARGLKLVFRKPFGKDLLKSKMKSLGEKAIPKANTFEIPKLVNKNKLILTSESSVSTSSYDLRQFHPKETTPNQTPKRQSVKRRNSKRLETTNLISKSSKRHGKGRNVERVSTSEDSDFMTLSRRVGCQNRNSSSGYVSCSECESESCADRCYCAAKARPRPPPPAPVTQESCDRGDKCCDCTAGESIYSCCGCDTESCADSDKCYCRTGRPPSRHPHAAKGPPHPPQPPHPSRQKSPRRRSAPGPATLDSLYYEPLRPKASSVLNASGMEFLTKRSSRFDTFERMSCSTELGRGGRRSYSSDNLHLDYDLFMATHGAGFYASRTGSMQLPMMMHRSKEALLSHKEAEVGALFSDGRLLSAHRGIYRGPSAALADSLGYLP